MDFVLDFAFFRAGMKIKVHHEQNVKAEDRNSSLIKRLNSEPSSNWNSKSISSSRRCSQSESVAPSAILNVPVQENNNDICARE